VASISRRDSLGRPRRGSDAWVSHRRVVVPEVRRAGQPSGVTGRYGFVIIRLVLHRLPRSILFAFSLGIWYFLANCLGLNSQYNPIFSSLAHSIILSTREYDWIRNLAN